MSVQGTSPTPDIKTLEEALQEAENSSSPPESAIDPPHYFGADNDIQCIDAIRESMSIQEFKGYLKGTVYKYIWRAGKKRQSTELTDLRKAQWFMNYLVHFSEAKHN